MQSVYLRPFTISDTEELITFKKNNQSANRLENNPNVLTHSHQLKEVGKSILLAQRDKSYLWGIFINDSNKLIGILELNNIVRGNNQEARLTITLDYSYRTPDFFNPALIKFLDYSFNDLKLHRIQIALDPKDKESLELFMNIGFYSIGLSKEHIKINTKWEDRQLLEILNENQK